MLQNKDIFRKYDIRGIYGKNLTDDTALNASKAFASMVYDETQKDSVTLSVGRDVRFSSENLFNSACRGLMESGINIIDIGVCPSPLTYFSVYEYNTDGYLMITGSHNPSQFNGIKIGTRNTVYHTEKIEEIYNKIISSDFPVNRPKGNLVKRDIVKHYLEFMSDHFKDLKENMAKLPKKIKVVTDAGSGTASEIAPAVFEELGAEVFRLHCKPDGSFPGHHPDPTIEENMADAKEILLKNGCDFAMGYDGDGDRLGALDSRGQMIWGDQLIGIFAQDVSAEYKGRKVVADVKASKGLFEHIEDIGMKPVMYLSGHSMIKEKMKLEDAVIGGEMSSHFFFCDRHFGFDDGIYASVRLLEAYVNRLLSGEISSSDELTRDIPSYVNTPEIREYCPDSVKFKLIKMLEEYFKDNSLNGLKVKDIVTIDGLRITFENGWGLIRASNTEPLTVTRFEAETSEDMLKIKSAVLKLMEEIKYDIQKKI